MDDVMGPSHRVMGKSMNSAEGTPVSRRREADAWVGQVIAGKYKVLDAVSYTHLTLPTTPYV